MSYLTLAFSGTHGSGKTTLAKLIAAKTGAQFLPSNAGEVHRQFGVTASENIPFNQRIEIQSRCEIPLLVQRLALQPALGPEPEQPLAGGLHETGGQTGVVGEGRIHAHPPNRRTA